MKIAIHDEDGFRQVYIVNTEDRQEALKEAWRLHRGVATPDGELPPPWTAAHALIAPKHLGTYDRVYGGNPELVHIQNGLRRAIGLALAKIITTQMQIGAELNPAGKALCPGCYMVALYDAAVILAQENGQSLSELGHSMAHIFTLLAQGEINLTEEINVMVDPETPTNPNWMKDGLVEQPPADGKFHKEPHNMKVAPLLGLEAQS